MSVPAETSYSTQVLPREKLNVKTFEATFFNGKLQSVEYLFYPEILGKECLQVGFNSLLPLFGGMIHPGIPRFTYISKLLNFVRLIHMDDCSYGDYSSCDCRHNTVPIEEHFDLRCQEDHWHHCCAYHVSLWLHFYLVRVILLKESQKNYEHLMSDVHWPITGFFYTIGEMATAEYSLEWAWNGTNWWRVFQNEIKPDE